MKANPDPLRWVAEARFSCGWGRGAAFLARGDTSEIREKSPGEGESWGQKRMIQPPFPCTQHPEAHKAVYFPTYDTGWRQGAENPGTALAKFWSCTQT